MYEALTTAQHHINEHMFMSECKWVAKIDGRTIAKTASWDTYFKEIEGMSSDKAVLSPFTEGDVEIKGGSPRFSTRLLEGINGDYQVGLVMHLDGNFVFYPQSLMEGFTFREEDDGIEDEMFSKWGMFSMMYLAYVENTFAEVLPKAGDGVDDDGQVD
jgi:hypothetical protein